MAGRLRRVNEQLKHVLSEGIAELKDPRIGFVTITGVEVAPDLGTANVFVSVLGNERKRDAALAALGRSVGVLQGKINRELRLRRTPLLTFHYDPSVERGVRMTALIDELAPSSETDEQPGE